MALQIDYHMVLWKYYSRKLIEECKDYEKIRNIDSKPDGKLYRKYGQQERGYKIMYA